MTNHTITTTTEQQLSPLSCREDFVQVDHNLPQEGRTTRVVQESTPMMAMDDEDDDNSVPPTTRRETWVDTTTTTTTTTQMTKRNNDITMNDILHVLLKTIKSVKGNIHVTMHELKSPDERMMEMISSSAKSVVVQEGSNHSTGGDKKKINKNGTVDSPRPANADPMRPINILVTIQQQNDHFVTRGELVLGMALVGYVYVGLLLFC